MTTTMTTTEEQQQQQQQHGVGISREKEERIVAKRKKKKKKLLLLLLLALASCRRLPKAAAAESARKAAPRRDPERAGGRGGPQERASMHASRVLVRFLCRESWAAPLRGPIGGSCQPVSPSCAASWRGPYPLRAKRSPSLFFLCVSRQSLCFFFFFNSFPSFFFLFLPTHCIYTCARAHSRAKAAMRCYAACRLLALDNPTCRRWHNHRARATLLANSKLGGGGF
ncbi:hypothetical protein BJV74DRAFT_113674 [Russula compacta]|nr:hypothetical protein BJV74DRAFT_113674 [Russula compacta]